MPSPVMPGWGQALASGPCFSVILQMPVAAARAQRPAPIPVVLVATIRPPTKKQDIRPATLPFERHGAERKCGTSVARQ